MKPDRLSVDSNDHVVLCAARTPTGGAAIDWLDSTQVREKLFFHCIMFTMTIIVNWKLGLV